MDSQFRVSRILLHGTLHVYMCGCDVSAINHNILIYMHEIKLYMYIYTYMALLPALRSHPTVLQFGLPVAWWRISVRMQPLLRGD